jgi:hypothetical protein
VKDKIKVGILIKSFEILLWEYRILEKLFNSEFAEIILLIKKNEDHVKINNENKSLLYLFHEKLDKYIFKNEYDYDKKINIQDLFKKVPLISYDSAEGNSGDNWIDKIDKEIKDYEIDVILNFGVALLSNGLLNIPRYGIWSYNIGDNKIIRDAPSVYREIVEKLPEIGCTVSVLRGDQYNGTVIHRTSIPTFTKSININKNRIYGLASLIIPRLIKGLFESGGSYLDKSICRYNRDIEIFNSKPYTSPNSLKALWNLILIFTSNLYRNIIYIKKDFWYLLYKINEDNKTFPAEIDSFNKLTAPRDKFWADPFIITKDENHYLFVEEYLFKTDKAHISVLKLDNKGALLSSERIIERPYHMSYPFTFKLNDKYYMIPESKENRTIQLYCCTSFPNKWEFVMNLMEDISATDSTLFFYKHKWWLFTAIDELNSPSIPFSELFLYYSEDLFSSDWQSHPMNPIITDIKISRPAGKIFILNNNLYRPSQDCSGGYGKAFNLNQITKLSESTYEESLVLRVGPDWNRKLIGTHTFNFDDNITVIDASSRRKRVQLGLFKN